MLQADTQALGGLPALIAAGPDDNPATLTDLPAQHRAALRDLLHEHGALLLRGFGIGSAEEFQAICTAATPGLIPYTGGGSPRTLVTGKVYTSTEYAATQHILLHAEASYFRQMPAVIWLFCEVPSRDGGETPLGDLEQVLGRLDPALVERFETRGVRYLYNLHDGKGFGRGWREAFGCTDRATVEDWLERQQADFAWLGDGTLHVELSAPGVRTHPGSGARIWGNQAANWHIASLDATTARALRRLYGSEDRLPKHAVFGDGSPIPDADIGAIIAVLKDAERTFRWQRGDLLVCDNARIAHGRRPFQGPRRVLVALA